MSIKDENYLNNLINVLENKVLEGKFEIKPIDSIGFSRYNLVDKVAYVCKPDNLEEYAQNLIYVSAVKLYNEHLQEKGNKYKESFRKDGRTTGDLTIHCLAAKLRHDLGIEEIDKNNNFANLFSVGQYKFLNDLNHINEQDVFSSYSIIARKAKLKFFTELLPNDVELKNDIERVKSRKTFGLDKKLDINLDDFIEHGKKRNQEFSDVLSILAKSNENVSSTFDNARLSPNLSGTTHVELGKRFNDYVTKRMLKYNHYQNKINNTKRCELLGLNSWNSLPLSDFNDKFLSTKIGLDIPNDFNKINSSFKTKEDALNKLYNLYSVIKSKDSIYNKTIKTKLDGFAYNLNYACEVLKRPFYSKENVAMLISSIGQVDDKFINNYYQNHFKQELGKTSSISLDIPDFKFDKKNKKTIDLKRGISKDKNEENEIVKGK